MIGMQQGDAVDLSLSLLSLFLSVFVMWGNWQRYQQNRTPIKRWLLVFDGIVVLFFVFQVFSGFVLLGTLLMVCVWAIVGEAARYINREDDDDDGFGF